MRNDTGSCLSTWIRLKKKNGTGTEKQLKLTTGSHGRRIRSRAGPPGRRSDRPTRKGLPKVNKAKGIDCYQTTLNGKPAIKFGNGDIFVDSSGNNALGLEDGDFSKALKQIEDRYGTDLSALTSKVDEIVKKRFAKGNDANGDPALQRASHTEGSLPQNPAQNETQQKSPERSREKALDMGSSYLTSIISDMTQNQER